MLTIDYINNINVVLKENDIVKVTSKTVAFDNWMIKIKNIYREDNEKMCAAYDRVEFPHINIPFIQKFKFKYGRYL